MKTPMKEEDVTERLSFAGRRLDDLLTLNGGNLPSADGSERQKLLQEFFFHLVGSVDVLAQLVNEKRALGFDPENVSVPAVLSSLPQGDPVKPKLQALHARTRGQAIPSNPYSDEGLIFRAYNYRHQVTHKRRNPFLFRVGANPPASFILDPRDPQSPPSAKSAQGEMRQIFDLVVVRCNDVLALL